MSSVNDTVTAPSATWEGYDMNLVLSPFYWGGVFSLILYGVTLLQAYLYFPTRDKIYIQLVAALLLALDTGSAALVAYGFAFYTIPHFGSLVPLGHLTPAIAAECTIATAVTFISQCYFGWQVWTMIPREKKSRIFAPGLIYILAIISLAGGIACSVVMFVDNENILANRSLTFLVAAGVSKGMAAVCDIVATIALGYGLSAAKTGFKQTDGLVKSVITWVVQRGLLISVIQSLVLIVFFAEEAALYWLPLHVNVTRLYVNTFFAMLNGRANLRKLRDPTYGGTSNSKWSVQVTTDRITDMGGAESVTQIGKNTDIETYALSDMSSSPYKDGKHY